MDTFNQPSALPLWCHNNDENVVQPPASLRASGYTGGEVPLAQHWNAQMQSLGDWVGYLNQANASTLMSTTLDSSTRLVGGGAWSYDAASATLSWSAPGGLVIPSIGLADNTFAAGSVALGDGVLAYVQSNAPFTTTAGITKDSKNVTGLQTTSVLAVGQSATGAGIPPNTTITAISGSTVTLSQAATATNSTATLTFAGSGALTVQSAVASEFLPNANTVIVALGRETSAYVGVNSSQMVVRNGESKTLLGTGFVSTHRAPAGTALTRNQAVYLATGAEGRTAGAFYPAEASSANGALRGQFVGMVVNDTAQGENAQVCTAGTLNGLSGLAVGTTYFLDPNTPGGLVGTAPTATGLFVVPVGIALSNTSLRISPTATRTLTAIQDGLKVSGPLVIKPHNNGNAFVVTGQDGETIVTSVTDDGFATLKRLAVTGPTNATDITSSTKITSPSFIATTGFKTHVPCGQYATANYTGGQVNTNTIHFDGNQLRTQSFLFNPLYAGSIVGINFSQTAPNTPTLTILGVETTEGQVGGSYTAYTGNPLGFATYRGGIRLAKGTAPLRQGWYYFMNITWAQTGFSNYVTVDLTVEYTT